MKVKEEVGVRVPVNIDTGLWGGEDVRKSVEEPEFKITPGGITKWGLACVFEYLFGLYRKVRGE